MKKQNPYLFRFNNYHHGQDSVLKRNKRCSQNSLQKLNCFVAFIDFYIFAKHQLCSSNRLCDVKLFSFTKLLLCYCLRFLCIIT